MKKIPFNKPSIATTETLENINQCFTNSSFENGYFTQLATQQLMNLTQAKQVLLTTSCTSALEIAALLLDLKIGDEVIMPSYTFVSTANAFVLRGATPVFVDIRPDTLNIDENLIEAAITKKTKAIVPMHYAGIGCNMEVIEKIAKKYQLSIIEDAAQCIHSTYKNKSLGTIGQLGTFSFHHTKNITSGFGGALLINDENLIDPAKIIWQKGTNREAFVKGMVDKYTWVDQGSAYLLNEINAALLSSQLKKVDETTKRRLDIWNQYHNFLQNSDIKDKVFSLPSIPTGCNHNAHLYYLILKDPTKRDQFIYAMKQQGIDTPFHYIPLHSAPAGRKFGRVHGDLKWTDHHSERLVRLPLYPGLSDEDVNRILNLTIQYL